MLSTFRFVGEADCAVALSAILTAVVRKSAIRQAPMHGFDAPLPGSGKGKLVDIASIIATGKEAGIVAQGRTEEELEKRLGALLFAGEQISIDNCCLPLGGAFLCALLTQPTVKANGQKANGQPVRSRPSSTEREEEAEIFQVANCPVGSPPSSTEEEAEIWQKANGKIANWRRSATA